MKTEIVKLCQANYQRILALVPHVETMEPGDAVKLRASGFMDLCVDVLMRKGSVIQISLAHYYEQNGDLVPDPDMEVLLLQATQMAYPKHIQHSTGAFRECLDERMRISDTAEFSDQSEFLSMWLGNLEAQGHRIVTPNPHHDGE